MKTLHTVAALVRTIVDAVQLRLGGDFRLVAREAQSVVLDDDVEVFFDLAAVGRSRPTRRFIFSRPRNLDPLRRTIAGDALQDRLGGLQEVLALARPFHRRKRGLSAHHQALAREVGAEDLGHRVGLQPRRLQRGGPPILERLERLRRSAVFNAESQSSPAGATVSRMRRGGQHVPEFAPPGRCAAPRSGP